MKLRHRQCYTGQTRKKYGKRILLFAMALSILALLMWGDVQLRPILRRTAEMEATRRATVVVNQAVGDTLIQRERAGEIIHVSRGANGNITAIETDTIALSMLQTALSSSIATALRDAGKVTYGIPLGTLTGSAYLTGRGPKVMFSFSFANGVTSDVLSTFEAAGINQTLHRLTLRVTVQVMAIAPGVRETLPLSVDFVLAETIIVGEIPNVITGGNVTTNVGEK